MNLKTRDMAMIAVMAAAICVMAPLSVFIGPIPISLSNFAVYLAAAVLGAKRGTIATALYLLLGAVGLPVFSGFSGGLQKLIGVTGGYLVSYLPCAWIVGRAVAEGETTPKKKWKLPLYMALGTLLVYALGTVWFMKLSGNTLGQALSLCVLPFIPGDAVKIIAVTLIAWPIRRAIYR